MNRTRRHTLLHKGLSAFLGVLLVAFVCVCASSTLAIAAITKGTVGVELVIPSHYEDPTEPTDPSHPTDPNDPANLGKYSFPGVLGIKMLVPTTVEEEVPRDPITGDPVYDPTAGSNGGYSVVPGVVGIKMMVPMTVEEEVPRDPETGDPVYDPTAGSNGGYTTIPGVIGIKLVVPNVTTQKGDNAGEANGETEGATTIPGMLGIHMAVPGNVQMTEENTGNVPADGDVYATGTPGVLGINMSVSTGTAITYVANNGTAQRAQEAVSFGKPLKNPFERLFTPTWAGRHIEGWYTAAPPVVDPADPSAGATEPDPDDPVQIEIDSSYRKWKFEDDVDNQGNPIPNPDKATTAVVLYAKWVPDDHIKHYPVTLYAGEPEQYMAEFEDDQLAFSISGDFPTELTEPAYTASHGVKYADGMTFTPDPADPENPEKYSYTLNTTYTGRGYETASTMAPTVWTGRYWEGGGLPEDYPVVGEDEDGNPAVVDYQLDQTLILPTPTLRDHEFQGWYAPKLDADGNYVDEDGTAAKLVFYGGGDADYKYVVPETGDEIPGFTPYVDMSGYPVTKITRQATGPQFFYAKWKSVQTFNVEFQVASEFEKDDDGKYVTDADGNYSPLDNFFPSDPDVYMFDDDDENLTKRDKAIADNTPATQTVAVNKRVLTPSNPSSAEYDFTSWYYKRVFVADDEPENKVDENCFDVEVEVDGNIETVTYCWVYDKWNFTTAMDVSYVDYNWSGDPKDDRKMTLYAGWTLKEYTIVFNTMNNSSISPNPAKVTSGGKLSDITLTPATPTPKEGEKFIGWMAKGASELWDVDEPITSKHVGTDRTLRLEAQYADQGKYKVFIHKGLNDDYDDGSGESVFTTFQVLTEKEADPADGYRSYIDQLMPTNGPNRTGHHIIGWYTKAFENDPDFSVDVNALDEEYVNHKANYPDFDDMRLGEGELPWHAWKFDDPDTEGVNEADTIDDYVVRCLRLADPSYDPDTAEEPNWPVNLMTDIHLYPMWGINVYDVNYYSRGDATEAFEVEKVKHGYTANGSRRQPAIGGYKFEFWSETKQTSGSSIASVADQYDFTTPVTGNVDLYAHYSEAQGWTVKFEPDDGDTADDEDEFPMQTVTDGTPASFPGNVPPKKVLKPGVEEGSTDPDDYEDRYFTGWFLETTPDPTEETPNPAKTYADTPYTFTEPVTKNITLKAFWSNDPADDITAKVYYVKFVDGTTAAEDTTEFENALKLEGGLAHKAALTDEEKTELGVGSDPANELVVDDKLVYIMDADGNYYPVITLHYGDSMDDLLGMFVDADGNPVAPKRCGYDFVGFWANIGTDDAISYIDHDDGVTDPAKRWMISPAFNVISGNDIVGTAWARVGDASDAAGLEVSVYDNAGAVTGTKTLTKPNVITLTAKWTARIDATIPMGVMFAVDGATGQATTPNYSDPDNLNKAVYGIRSRTPEPLTVESVSFAPDVNGLNGFFESTTSGSGLNDYTESKFWVATAPVGDDPELNASVRYLANGPGSTTDAPDGRYWAVVLPLAGSDTSRTHNLTDAKQRDLFTVPAFTLYADANKDKTSGELIADKVTGFPTSDLKLKLGLTQGPKIKPKPQPDNEQQLGTLTFVVSVPH